MSSNLLDWLLGRERRFSWRYALRIALITAACHAGCLLIVSIVVVTVPYLRGFYFKEIMVLIPVLVRQYGPVIPLGVIISTGFSMLPYWAVFVLAALSDESNPIHRWRVWLAWLLMTFPFAAVYSLSLFETNGFALYVFFKAYPLPLTALSPLVTFVGVMADYLVRQFLRWLHHDDRAQSSPSQR